MEYYLSAAPGSEALQDAFTVIRRLLTALTHHCKSAEQFSPISDVLYEYLATSVKVNDAVQEERLRRIIEVLAVPCSVRGGSRIGSNHLSTILSQILLVTLTDELHESFLKLSVSCLIAGDMALWMGLGRRVFERAWSERPALALHMTGALLELGWGGWQMIALPHVVKMSLTLLEADKETMQVLEVLSAAHWENKLAGVDERWTSRLHRWVTARFANWGSTESQVSIHS